MAPIKYTDIDHYRDSLHHQYPRDGGLTEAEMEKDLLRRYSINVRNEGRVRRYMPHMDYPLVDPSKWDSVNATTSMEVRTEPVISLEITRRDYQTLVTDQAAFDKNAQILSLQNDDYRDTLDRMDRNRRNLSKAMEKNDGVRQAYEHFLTLARLVSGKNINGIV
jgi:hypothetical protein